MLASSARDYGDPVPNQPKYPGRHLRMDPQRWEAFGTHAALRAGDRTKELIQIIDWLLYAPDAQPPERVPPAELIASMREAADEAREEALHTPDDRRRESLKEKAAALQAMATLVRERAKAAGLLDD
ncbi:hypothetical protein AB0O28_18630 [Microbispora sp. NPDC088329]|uniref:hypothetical protein n=1 Tax=Microbispora sp. NPDC088329 TaxID=3154869 RepID=UPI00342DC352